MPAQMFDENHCSHCGKKPAAQAKLSRCAACHTAPYCSRQCQKANWSRHKDWCKIIVDQAKRDAGKKKQVALILDPVTGNPLRECDLILPDPDNPEVIRSPFAFSVGMPLCMLPVAPRGSAGQQYNSFAATLCIVIDPNEKDFGRMRTPSGLPMMHGEVLLYRADGKDLDWAQEEVIISYLNTRMLELTDVVDQTSGGFSSPKVREMATAINRENFRAYFEQYKAKKGDEGEHWRNMEFPGLVEDAQ